MMRPNRPLRFRVAPLVSSIGFLALVAIPSSLWLGGCQFPQVVKETVPPLDSPSVGAQFAEIVPTSSTAKAAPVDPNTPGLVRLNHQNHAIEQELSCDTCHEISGSGSPGMPDHDTCSVCHDIDIDNPSEDCMLCHVLSPAAIAEEDYFSIEILHVPAPKEGIKFDHTPFADDYETCAQCHSQVAHSVASTDNLRGDHQSLFSGARALGVDTNNCALCHSDMSKTSPPPSHNQPNFQQAHGGMYAADPNLCMTCHTQNQCETCHQNTKPQSHFRPEWVHAHGKVGGFNDQACLTCHTEQACQTCHQQMMPKDHTNFFRRRSHGKIATWDRDRCMTCHKQDYCEACHIGSAPRPSVAPYHVPGTACLDCHSPASPVWPTKRHGPLPPDSCVKCHQM